MPLFRKKSAEEQQLVDQVHVAKLRVKVAKNDLREIRTRAKGVRVQAKSEQFRREHAQAHSSGHHSGRCGAACRAGRVMHGHRG